MDKQQWLEDNGFKPMTDDVMDRFLKWYESSPFSSDIMTDQRTFTYYKQYGDAIYPCSDELVEKSSVPYLAARDRICKLEFGEFDGRGA